MKLADLMSAELTQLSAGCYVKEITDDELKKHQAATGKMNDNWEILQYQVKAYLCDENGKDLEGYDTIEEMKAVISEGKLRDIIMEAQESLTLGKRVAERLRATASLPDLSGKEEPHSKNSD